MDRRAGSCAHYQPPSSPTKGETQEASTTLTLRPRSSTGYFLLRDAAFVCAIFPVVIIAEIFLYSSFVTMFFSTS